MIMERKETPVPSTVPENTVTMTAAILFQLNFEIRRLVNHHANIPIKIMPAP